METTVSPSNMKSTQKKILCLFLCESKYSYIYVNSKVSFCGQGTLFQLRDPQTKYISFHFKTRILIQQVSKSSIVKQTKCILHTFFIINNLLALNTE